jgi:hypothetical protein
MSSFLNKLQDKHAIRVRYEDTGKNWMMIILILVYEKNSRFSNATFSSYRSFSSSTLSLIAIACSCPTNFSVVSNFQAKDVDLGMDLINESGISHVVCSSPV